MFKIDFSDTTHLYYLNYKDNYSDCFVAKKMNIKVSKYRAILIKFNAIYKYGMTYFKNVEDAQKAIEELESIVIMNELAVNKNG